MAKKTEKEATPAPAPVPVAPVVKDPPKYVTHAEIESLIRSINAKFDTVEPKLAEATFRLETFMKIMCQTGSVSYSSFVKGLRQFNIFSQKVENLKKIPKLSDRIKEAIAYNTSIEATDEFKILADDIDILKDAVNAESISKENFDLSSKLESTALFRELLSKYLPKS